MSEERKKLARLTEADVVSPAQAVRRPAAQGLSDAELEDLAAAARPVQQIHLHAAPLPSPQPKQHSPFMWGFGIAMGVICAFCLIANFFGFLGGFVAAFEAARHPTPIPIKSSAPALPPPNAKQLEVKTDLEQSLDQDHVGTVDWSTRRAYIDEATWIRLDDEAKHGMMTLLYRYYVYGGESDPYVRMIGRDNGEELGYTLNHQTFVK